MSNAVSFTVLGVPQPQGSTKAFRHRSTGRVVTTSANPHLAIWRQAAGWAAKAAAPGVWFDGPVKVAAVFTFTRPKSVKRAYHTVKPDVDKLVRALGDALTGVLWRDDAQVVAIAVRKVYGPQPQTEVTVSEFA